MSAWRYIAARLNGDGTETFLDYDIPLKDAKIVRRLSGHDAIEGFIAPQTLRLQKDGEFIFDPWSTVIYAELNGVIRGGAIFVDIVEDGNKLEIETIGLSGYPTSMPYKGDIAEVQVDPMDMARHIWDHLQSFGGGDLSMVLDGTKSPTRIGDEPTDVEFETKEGETVEFEAGPYKLGWYQTTNLAKEFDDLAKRAPFDYLTELSWTKNGKISKRIRMGHPHLGRRRRDLRFAVGENLAYQPPIMYSGDDFASEVWVLGAGEGRKQRRDLDSQRKSNRLRRVAVVEDKSLRSHKAARVVGSREIKRRTGAADIEMVMVKDHSHAPLGSYGPGEEILILTNQGWSGPKQLWCRIITMTIDTKDNSTELEIIRSDKVE